MNFWFHILSQYVFTNRDLVVSPWQPVRNADDKSYVDIAVEDLSSLQDFHLLMYVEVIPGGADNQAVDEAEQRILGHCARYCAHNDPRPIWVMICCGPRFRLFMFDHINRRLRSCYPSTPRQGDAGLYLSLRDNETQLRTHLEFVKSSPIPVLLMSTIPS